MSQKQNSSNNQDHHGISDTEFSENDSVDYSSFSDDIDPIENSTKSEGNKNPSEEQVRISMLEQEIARTKDQMMRTVAEAENGRKRALKEREDASKFAVSKFSRDLLNVADNLQRALDSIPHELLDQHPQIKNLIDGISATERELITSFTKNGIKKFEPLNEPFNPNFHEVMFEAPMPDKQNGIIIQVIEAGYTLNDRLLRPARVGIAKNDNSTPNSSSSEPGHTIDTQV